MLFKMYTVNIMWSVYCSQKPFDTAYIFKSQDAKIYRKSIYGKSFHQYPRGFSTRDFNPNQIDSVQKSAFSMPLFILRPGRAI